MKPTLVPLVLTLLGCSSAQPVPVSSLRSPPSPQSPMESPGLADASVTSTLDASASLSWPSLSRDELCRIVTEGAHTRIRESQPDFDITSLDRYLASPEGAPALRGRVVDQLLDLALVDSVQGRLQRAERTVNLVRQRAANRNLAFAASTLLSEVKRRGAEADNASQERAIESVLGALPRARFGGATVVFQLFQTQGQLTARLSEVHQQLVAHDTARSALWYSELMPGVVSHRDRFLAVIDRVRAAQSAQGTQPDFAFGTVNLQGARDAREVVVAVWDLGTNPELFRRQLFTNPRELPNGLDDDGNHQADDLHGLASDGAAPNTALLYNPGEDTLRQYSPFLRGIMDLRAGMAQTPAAQRVLELQRGVTDLAAQRDLDNHLDAIGEWAHGTHVAGILMAQNPFARLAVFRSAWAGERRLYHDRGPTDAELDAERSNMDAIADFINQHHVRVVNASLGFSIEYVENELRHERARYANDDLVRARARVIQDRRRANWQAVFDHCPDTLFVVAAGNSNQDVLEYQEVPAANSAPNLMVVGAVDRFGNWATFTNSNPERVRVFDHGVEVDSVIPSGEHVPLSGTSMASPNVANLAGKLFALNPALTPARAITLITETVDPIAAPFNGGIANETRAVARLRAERPAPPGPRRI